MAERRMFAKAGKCIGETLRQSVYKSGLPYSFSYKIKRYFWGKPCPICGVKMQCYELNNLKIPSIQHNKPISKGGKHEIDNISVICLSCNVSLRNQETEKLNNKDVIEAWHLIKGDR